MSNLGSMYRDGKGVTQDYSQAERWFRKAADAGIAKDDTETVRWFRKAADAGYTRAMTNLGWMYRYGEASRV